MPGHLTTTEKLCQQGPTWDQQRRYLDTTLRDVLFPMSSSSLQGTLASSCCTCTVLTLAKPTNFWGSTEPLKAQIRHLPSRRVTMIQTTGATMARCMTEEHMYLEQQREASGLMLGAFSSSRALRDAGCPVPSSLSRPRELTPRASLSIADASSTLGCLCWFCFSVKSALAHRSALCAVYVPSSCACSDCSLMSHMHRSLSALPCLSHSYFFFPSVSIWKIPFFLQLFLPLSEPTCVLHKTLHVTDGV